VRHQPTFYARAENWFAWLDLILAAALFVSAFIAGKPVEAVSPADIASAWV
jgi:hypothetical protein